MYRFSRAIYREIASEIIEDPYASCPHASHERVLRACETTVERMATDRHYFARPARTLTPTRTLTLTLRTASPKETRFHVALSRLRLMPTPPTAAW